MPLFHPAGTPRLYKAGIYARLSVLDSGKADGDSIKNQIALLERYVSNTADLERVELFVDNGYSGTNFDRPAWERLLSKVHSGEIDCVVVKDLSRLGRNYIETGEFLEKEFPRLGVRFIAVSDGYDSAQLRNADEIGASLKNIVNDYYARDISQKSKSALKVKRTNGEFIGDYAPHGYLKDPANKNHLIVDPETAPVIQQIFRWRADKEGYTAITRKLNEADVPSPGRYRFEHGIITNNNKRGSGLLWNRRVLKDILNNIAYIGHLAQGKSAQDLANGIPFHSTPEEEWDIAYHTHEPIVDEELFCKVQTYNAEQAAKYHANCGKYADLPKGKNLFGKKLVCADCGYVLKLYRNIARGGKKAWFTYQCPTYQDHGALACTKKKISKDALDAAVLESLRVQMDLFIDAQKALERLLSLEKPRKRSRSAEDRLNGQLQRKSSLSAALYTDYKAGVLTQEEYLYAKEKYRAEIEQLRRELDGLQGRRPEIEEPLALAEQWRGLIEHYRGVDTLTKDLVDAFVDQVRLAEDQSIEVSFRFRDVFAQVVEAQASLSGEVA